MKTAVALATLTALGTLMASAATLPPGSAREPSGQVHAGPVLQATKAGPARYIVILSAPAVPGYSGGIAGLQATSPASLGQASLDADGRASQAYASHLQAQQAAFVTSAARVLRRAPEVVYQFQFALNAVVMVLDPAEAAQIAKLPGVKSVERDVAQPLDTDVGPQWIGAPGIWNGTATGGLPGTQGEGIIIGVLDTGINMAHPSFAATGGDGYVHTNPFGSGVFKGWCDPANPNYSPTYVCNDKLIGAWDYSDASWGEGDGPGDNDGHGSHTASTSGGNYLAPGTVTLGSYSFSPAISGVAPHANIIMYDVCGDSCYNTDVIAALNQAILDGVHVTNESIGIGGDAFTGAKQQAYLSVFNAGITSVRSAGNSGPGAGTVGGTPPWVITVGANTHNRAGSNALTSLAGGATAPPGGGTLTGLGVSDASVVGDLVYAGNAPYSDPLCQSPAASNSFTGKIVVCDRGTNARVAKGWNVLQGGAIGMVLANDAANGASLNGDLHHLPAVHISYADGVALKTWMASGTGHQGRIAGTTFSYAPTNGDVMAGFSSRGPHPIPNLLTPDVTNPGVDILAAYRSGLIDPETTSVEYAFSSGTSMSSPHTAGSAALVKAVHPTWTPAEIKSALMGTGKYTGVRKEDGVTPAIPFDMGTGRVDLNNAANASLLLDETGAHFAAGAANPKALNLASLADSACAGACSWTRTVKATRAGTWTASYVTPTGMTLSATPSTFTLTAGQTQTLGIQADVSGLPLNQWAFGYLVLSNDDAAAGEVIHLTVAVRPTAGAAAISVNPGSLSSTQEVDTVTSQTLNIANTGTGMLTWTIAEEPALFAAGRPVDRTLAPSGNAPVAPQSLAAAGPYAHGMQAVTPVHRSPTALVNDGSFENGPPPASAWTEVTDSTCEWIGDWSGVWGVAAYDGTFDFWAGGYCGSAPTTSSVEQIIAVPVTDATLSFWYLSYRPDDDDAAVDTAYVQVNGTPVWTYNLTQANNTYPNWVNATVDLSAYAGQNVALKLGAVSAGDSTGNIRFDYVEFLAAQTCSNPADVPWLSVNPTSGTTDAAGSSDVTIGLDSTGLVAGTYDATLCVTSNDPDRPLVAVPVSLTVLEQGGVPNIDVSPLSLSSTQAANTATSQTLDLGNSGTAQLDWTIAEDPATGCASPADVPWLSAAPASGSTAAGGSTPVTVGFDSSGLAAGSYDANLCVDSNDPDAGPGNGTGRVIVPVVLSVESGGGGGASIALAMGVGTEPGVCAATGSLTVAPGTTVYYCYRVTNTGAVTLNSHDLVDDQLGAILTGWSYSLAPGASIDTVSAGVTASAVITGAVTNHATWTARGEAVGGGSVSASAAGSATVRVSGQAGVVQVPALTPLGVVLLGAALAGVGALRRRRR